MLSERRIQGYTLIEVLVAFMIMALALTVLLRIFSGGLRNISVSSDYAQAVLIAESRLAAAGIDGPLYPGETTGIDGEQFEWTRRVTEYVPSPVYSNAAQDLQAWHVTVSVAWPNGSNSRSIEISTIRLLQDEESGS